MALTKHPAVRGPVCGVFAAAMASDKPFEDVLAIARRVVARSASWKGRLYYRELIALLDALNIQHREAEGYKGTALISASRTLHSERQYIVFITGHYLTLHQGICYDQSRPEGVPVDLYRENTKRIKRVIRIL